MNRKYLAPEQAHKVFAQHKPLLAYKKTARWKKLARTRLTDLLFPNGQPIYIKPSATIKKISTGAYEIVFWSELGALVKGRLVIPQNNERMPLVICLQGHTLNDEKRSVGITSLFGEGTIADIERYTRRGINTAEQAVREGYATFAIEQRGFGERSDMRDRDTKAHYGGRCHNPAMASLIYGRTLIGSRVHDVRVALTVMDELVRIHKLPIDMKRIACIGHSGGGTTAYYASALDERISAVMASGCVCQYDESIASIDHCICNYVPNIRTWFEMGDIGCMIAPRPLTVVHGKKDPNFPIAGVKSAVATLKKAYRDNKASAALTLVEGQGVHEFFPDIAWPAFRKITKW